LSNHIILFKASEKNETKIIKIDFNGFEKNKSKIIGKIQVDSDPFNGCEGQTMRIERDMESRRSVHSVLVSEWKIETSSDTSQHGHDLDPGEDHSAATTKEWDVTEVENPSLAQDNP
jgi:tRNA G37 N-methylase TrmD